MGLEVLLNPLNRCTMKKKYARIGIGLALCGLLSLASYIGYRIGLGDVESERVNTVLLLQERHRFADVPVEDRDSLIVQDLRMRREMMEDWTKSLHHLKSYLPNWPLLEKLIRSADSARVISIYEADTMGFSGIRSRTLSVIPLTADEYLLFQGKNEDTRAYYSNVSRMIVLRCDKRDNNSQDPYSYRSAISFVHELCHDYLHRKGFVGPDPCYGDPDGQHAWIDSIETKINSSIPFYSSTSVYFDYAFNHGEHYPAFQELLDQELQLRVKIPFWPDSAAHLSQKVDSIDTLKKLFVQEHSGRR